MPFHQWNFHIRGGRKIPFVYTSAYKVQRNKQHYQYQKTSCIQKRMSGILLFAGGSVCFIVQMFLPDFPGGNDKCLLTFIVFLYKEPIRILKGQVQICRHGLGIRISLVPVLFYGLFYKVLYPGWDLWVYLPWRGHFLQDRKSTRL